MSVWRSFKLHHQTNTVAPQAVRYSRLWAASAACSPSFRPVFWTCRLQLRPRLHRAACRARRFCNELLVAPRSWALFPRMSAAWCPLWWRNPRARILVGMFAMNAPERNHAIACALCHEAGFLPAKTARGKVGRGRERLLFGAFLFLNRQLSCMNAQKNKRRSMTGVANPSASAMPFRR